MTRFRRVGQVLAVAGAASDNGFGCVGSRKAIVHNAPHVDNINIGRSTPVEQDVAADLAWADNYICNQWSFNGIEGVRAGTKRCAALGRPGLSEEAPGGRYGPGAVTDAAANGCVVALGIRVGGALGPYVEYAGVPCDRRGPCYAGTQTKTERDCRGKW